MLDTFSSLSLNISLLFSLSVPCQSVPVQQTHNAGQEQPTVKEGVADTLTTGCGLWW